MFKSIFMKYITVMMVIVFSGFAILTSLMTAFMRSYSDNFKDTADFKQARVQTVSSSMSVYVKNDYEKRLAAAVEQESDILSSYSRLFQKSVSTLSNEFADCAIFLSDRNSKVCSFGASPSHKVTDFFTVDLSEARIPGDLNSRLRSGETVTEMGVMNVQNSSPLLKQECIFTSIPLTYSDDYIGSLTVAVFSSGTISSNYDKYRSVVRNVAGSVFSYVLSDYSKRINKIDAGALISYNDEFQTITDLLLTGNQDAGEMMVFVVDKTRAVTVFGTYTAKISASDLFTSSVSQTMIPEDIAKVLATGEEVNQVSNMGGILKRPCVFTANPVMINHSGNKGDEYIGAVVVAMFDTDTDNSLHSTIMTLIMATLWIMLASLIAIYIMSEKLTTPIRKMNDAAKKMSKGKFDTKIEVRGRDEIAELSKSFNEMSESLGNLEKMRSSFISDVSHELRTPMTSIGGFIDSILDGAIPPDKEKYYLEIVSSEIKRLSRLVTSLLEISRMESGKDKLNLDSFDICEMARTILISNEQRIEEKNLDVEFECDEDNIDVIADRDKIHQCLFNICDNAIKFSNTGGKYILKIKDKGERVEVSVYNEGIGITEEDLPFVFERFYKSDKSRGLDKKGVGLGLYLVKSMIEAHGEKIWVESESGKWCRFTFTLQKKKI